MPIVGRLYRCASGWQRVLAERVAAGGRSDPASAVGQARSGRRRSSQSRSAQIVVLKAISAHGMASGAKATTSVASGVGAAVAADDPRLERDRHDRRLEPRVEPDDLARLDEQAGLLPGLADGRLVDGLVDLEEAARLRPDAAAGLDARGG